MKLVASQDAQLRCDHTLRPGAPALLLLNSLGTSLEMWDEQFAALSECYELIRFDARGHGQSTLGEHQEATIDLLARDALAVLDACGVARAHLCGLSLGGMIGMHIATHWPDRVLKVVLSNTTPHMPPRDAWETRIRTARAQGMAPLVEPTLARWFTPEFHQAHPEKVEHIRATLLSCDPAGYAACCAAIRDMDQRESIRAITAKALVIGGAKDPGIPPAQIEALAASIPDAKLVMLDAAHLANIERAEQYTNALMDFLGITPPLAEADANDNTAGDST